MPSLKFGVQVLPQEVTWDEWKYAWLLVDQLGFDSNWSYDHVHAPRGNPANDCFEGWVGMGALAALTKDAWTGMLVSPVTFRNPGLLVKMATTLDHITGGKSIFGVGAGWHVNEHHAYGFGFPEPGERVTRLKETLQITHALWGEDDAVSFDGTYYKLDQAFCHPKPLQKPRPPIMVAGGGPRIVRLVARYADMYDCWPPLDQVEQRYALLADECARIGRPVEDITRSLSVDFVWCEDTAERARIIEAAGANVAPGRDPEAMRSRLLVGGAEEMHRQIERYVETGVQQVILHVPSPYNLDGLTRFAREVVPHFKNV